MKIWWFCWRGSSMVLSRPENFWGSPCTSVHSALVSARATAFCLFLGNQYIMSSTGGLWSMDQSSQTALSWRQSWPAAYTWGMEGTHPKEDWGPQACARAGGLRNTCGSPRVMDIWAWRPSYTENRKITLKRTIPFITGIWDISLELCSHSVTLKDRDWFDTCAVQVFTE